MSLFKTVENAFIRAARPVSRLGFPLRWETLELDDNRSLWAASTPGYQPNPALKGDIIADLAIIGGGFTGVSTAYHFSQRFPNKRVALIEARSLANGASGRNGGMMLNWIYGMGPMSPAVTQRVYQATRETIDWIERLIREHDLQVGFRRDGCFEVYTTGERDEAAAADAEFYGKLGIPVRYLSAAEVQARIELGGVRGGLFDPGEGQLNGAQFIRALKPVLEARGVAIYENTRVTRVDEGATIELTTPGGRITARAIVLAANGYTGKLGYFRKAYFPLHSHVFATGPADDAALNQMGWHAAAGFSDDLNRLSYGSRTPEGHIVFGGGSNRSYDYLFNNRTAYPGSPAAITGAVADMRRTLTQYLPATAALPIAYQWTGTLAISLRRNCSMGVRGQHKNVYYALGYSGHGVVAANLAGRVLTDLYSGSIDAWRGLPFLHADFAPIPLEPFRWLGYQMFTRLTGRSPREQYR
jgi:glycine/D-amino acid oxidase-like deaminating enzyme